MANSDQIIALLRSYLEEDETRFLSVAMQLAAHEAKIGHGRLAQEIRQLVDEAKNRTRVTTPNTQGFPTPISRPKGELSDLLTVTYPQTKLPQMVLGDGTRGKIDRILEEQRNISRITAHGLEPRRKILLVGPPGTGKTMSASVIACELGLPLFAINLDSLFTKFLGETASKLRLIFRAIGETRGVYLFDEFDSIGTQRDFGDDVGEIRRVVTSFLQLIEQDSSPSLILAATNHPTILDLALFRRFDDMVRYELPNIEQIRALIERRLISFEYDLSREVLENADGLSHAEIIKACDDAAKDAIISDRAYISGEALTSHLEERRSMHLPK